MSRPPFGPCLWIQHSLSPVSRTVLALTRHARTKTGHPGGSERAALDRRVKPGDDVEDREEPPPAGERCKVGGLTCPLVIHAIRPALDSTQPSSKRTRARRRCQRNKHGLLGLPRSVAAGRSTDPASGVLEPYALGGIPEVVGFASFFEGTARVSGAEGFKSPPKRGAGRLRKKVRTRLFGAPPVLLVEDTRKNKQSPGAC
jgi:hypothetical protein